MGKSRQNGTLCFALLVSCGTKAADIPSANDVQVSLQPKAKDPTKRERDINQKANVERMRKLLVSRVQSHAALVPPIESVVLFVDSAEGSLRTWTITLGSNLTLSRICRTKRRRVDRPAQFSSNAYSRR